MAGKHQRKHRNLAAALDLPDLSTESPQDGAHFLAITLLAEQLALARQLNAVRKLIELGRRHREERGEVRRAG